MTTHFDPVGGLLIVKCRLKGPAGRVIARLALDTGATMSMVNWDLADLLGYDPAGSPDRIQVTTGSGVEFAPQISVKSLTALGISRRNFQMLCHTLPPSATVDGLLGLDFMRRKKLSIDFLEGTIELR